MRAFTDLGLQEEIVNLIKTASLQPGEPLFCSRMELEQPKAGTHD